VIGRATWDALGAPAEYFLERAVYLKGYERATTVWGTSFQAVEGLLASSEPAV